MAGLAADGVDVTVTDIPSKLGLLEELVKQIEAANRKSIAVVGDVTIEGQVQNIVKQTVEAFGGLDIVSICASSIITNQAYQFGRLRWLQMPGLTRYGR